MTKNVWAVWPTANPPHATATIKLWQAAGYKTAIWVDPGAPRPEGMNVIMRDKWLGFPHAINRLCHYVPGDVVVCAGDDIHPTEGEAMEVIREEFLDTFPDSFGVMQPTGDRFGSIDDCCPSPWVGRAFIEQAYEGKGPYNEDYFHYFCDQEIQEVAVKLGAFQQREDLSQYHDHWQREEGDKRPPHLMKALEGWKRDRNIFKIRQAEGFPGCERGVK